MPAARQAWARSVGVTGIPTFVFNEKYAVVRPARRSIAPDLEAASPSAIMAKLAEEAQAEAEPRAE